MYIVLLSIEVLTFLKEKLSTFLLFPKYVRLIQNKLLLFLYQQISFFFFSRPIFIGLCIFFLWILGLLNKGKHS